MTDHEERDRPEMHPSTADLREGFAALTCEPPVDETADCPEPATIHAAVCGELSPSELRAVVEHTAACPECAADWRLAMALEEAARSGAREVAPVEPSEWVEPVASARARRRAPLRLVALAATVVIALLAAGVWLTAGPGTEPVPDGAPTFRAAGPGEIESLLADEPLDAGEPVLRWRIAGGAPAGTTYDVRVSADLEIVAEAEGLEEPRFRLPSEALADLPPGTELEWRVEAHLPDGTRETATFYDSIENESIGPDRSSTL